MEEYGTDALRFYLMRDVPFGSDGVVAWTRSMKPVRAESGNEYGTLRPHGRDGAAVPRGMVPRSRPIRRSDAELEGLPQEWPR